MISDKHPEVKIAKRDITCYKEVIKHRLSKYITSLFKDFVYKIGIEYKQKMIVTGRWIDVGFHSYSNKAVLSKDNRFGYEIFFVKCIIPKGSEYYYNSYWCEYVSNQIIIKEIF